MSDIEERLRGEYWWLNVSGEEAADEIRTLRAHLNHRSDVNAQLRAKVAMYHADALHTNAERSEAAAEIERLTAALRAALPVLIEDMKDGNERSDGADLRAISLIRAALEGKK